MLVCFSCSLPLCSSSLFLSMSRWKRATEWSNSSPPTSEGGRTILQSKKWLMAVSRSRRSSAWYAASWKCWRSRQEQNECIDIYHIKWFWGRTAASGYWFIIACHLVRVCAVTSAGTHLVWHERGDRASDLVVVNVGSWWAHQEEDKPHRNRNFQDRLQQDRLLQPHKCHGGLVEEAHAACRHSRGKNWTHWTCCRSTPESKWWYKCDAYPRGRRWPRLSPGSSPSASIHVWIWSERGAGPLSENTQTHTCVHTHTHTHTHTQVVTACLITIVKLWILNQPTPDRQEVVACLSAFFHLVLFVSLSVSHQIIRWLWLAVVSVHQGSHVGCWDILAEPAVIFLITGVTDETDKVIDGLLDWWMIDWQCQVYFGHEPVSEQQSSEDVGSVFSFDLIWDHHLLHHLLGDSWQSPLLQIQKHRPWNTTTWHHTLTHWHHNSGHSFSHVKYFYFTQWMSMTLIPADHKIFSELSRPHQSTGCQGDPQCFRQGENSRLFAVVFSQYWGLFSPRNFLNCKPSKNIDILWSNNVFLYWSTTWGAPLNSFQGTK